MKSWCLILFVCSFPFISRSEETIKELQFPKCDVRDVLAFYQRLTGTPVLVSLDLQALVTIESSKPMSREEAVELIRKTLLERYGIEFRSSDRGETLVTWSQDPKYPRRSDTATTTETEADQNARLKRRIRIIGPAIGR